MFRAEVMAGPALFAQNIDFERRAILFVRLTQDEYRAASFLDNRILTADMQGGWIRFETVAEAVSGAQIARPLHFIFHSGHVGSTLLSRLLEGVPGVLGLREPLILRGFAAAQDRGEPGLDALIGQQTVLWARGFADTSAVVVKATSSAARLGPALMAAAPASRAICLNVGLGTYLATLLAGENSAADLAGHGPERAARLAALTGGATPAVQTLGEQAALAWVTETLTQADLARTFGARVLRLDFDAFLANVEAGLRAACSHYGLSAPEAYFTGAAQNPALSSYAKATEAPYSPQLRAEILADARVRFADEIARGHAWAAALARENARVATLLA